MKEGLPEAERNGGVTDGKIDTLRWPVGEMGEVERGQFLLHEVSERVLDISKHLIAQDAALPDLALTLILH